MGESELFSDKKSDFERSYRSEILVAGLPAPLGPKTLASGGHNGVAFVY